MADRTPETPLTNVGTPEEFKKRVILLPMKNQTVLADEVVMRESRKAFTEVLEKSHSVILVSPDELKSNLLNSEGKPYAADIFIAKARQAGVPALIESHLLDLKVERLGDQVGLFRTLKVVIKAKVRVRVLATNSGQNLFDETRNGELETEMTRVAQYPSTDKFLQEDPLIVSEVVGEVLKAMTPPLIASLKKLSWEGRIAMIQGERIYLNAGRMTGLRPGDLLRVFEPGKDVFDPATGLVIGRLSGRMKGTLEVIGYFGKDGAVSVVHSGSGFLENDLVQLY